MKYREMLIEASDVGEEQRADKKWWRRFKLRVLSSPAGEMAPGEAVACEYDDTQLKTQLANLDARELDTAGLVELGRVLGSLLLPDGQKGEASAVRELFLRSLDLVGQDAGLRVRLRLPPELAALPWEYAYVARSGTPDGMAGFISLNAQVCIVRHEVLRSPVPSVRISGDITMVAALASPRAPDLDDINLDQEEQHLRKDLEQRPGVKVKILMRATLADVLAAIPRAAVFHFAGHGTYRQQAGPLPRTTTGRGALVLEDERVDAENLAITLQRNGVRLVVLNSCESGRGGGMNVWGGIGAALVRCEVPAVVANQYKILHKCAVAFSQQFYRALVGGLPIERAVSAGRIAAYNADPNGRDWGVPVLYLRAEDGELFAGAGDADVRDTARTAVEQLLVKQQILQQHVEVVGKKVVFGPQILNWGTAASRETAQPNPADNAGPPARPADGGVNRDSGRKEQPADTASATAIEARNSPPPMELASGALRPVLLKLIAESVEDDLPLAFQHVFDLSYELSRGREADAGLIEERVKSLVALAPAIVPELQALFERDDFKSLAPSVARVGLPATPSLSHATSTSSQGEAARRP